MTMKTEDIWLIRLYFPYTRQSYQQILTPQKDIVLGRLDHTNSDEPPDVDLNPYNASDFGVSRHHVRLSVRGGHLSVTDLESGNGTYIGETQLEANVARTIRHGEDLFIGHLHAQVQILTSPVVGSTIHTKDIVKIEDSELDGEGKHLLVVTNNPDMMAILSDKLNDWGYKVYNSKDTLGAIRIYRRYKPNAVMVDLNLADINGMELCRYIRRDVEKNDTPVIAFSTRHMDEDVNGVIQAGADVFLELPFTYRELRHVVSSLVQQFEKGVAALQTKHLIATAPLKAMQPESRKDSAILFVAGTQEPITINLRKPITLGRKASGTSDIGSHIDLSRYNAVDNGVSRKHAILGRKDDIFYIEDNHSVNGTFLNGEPVQPNNPQVLQNADEIRLGRLRIYIYFLTDEEIKHDDKLETRDLN